MREFADFTFAKCLENYLPLQADGRIDGNLLSEVVNGAYFREIVRTYVALEAESALLSGLGSSVDFGENVRAIIYQTLNNFVFEYEGDVITIAARGLSYLMNPLLDGALELETKQFIHGLAVGV